MRQIMIQNNSPYVTTPHPIKDWQAYDKGVSIMTLAKEDQAIYAGMGNTILDYLIKDIVNPSEDLFLRADLADSLKVAGLRLVSFQSDEKSGVFQALVNTDDLKETLNIKEWDYLLYGHYVSRVSTRFI